MKNEKCSPKFIIELDVILLVLKIIIIFVLSSLLITTILHHLNKIYASTSNTNIINKINNETFIENPTAFMENPTAENPTAQVLVFTLSNGASLSDYYIPKSTDLNISSGKWTIEQLQKRYPEVIDKIGTSEFNNEFLLKKSVIIGKDAELNILSDKIRLYSLSIKDNDPAVIINYGKTTVLNSSITSWDPQLSFPDPNPYHPRSFMVSIGDGKMDVFNSTISYLGFSLGGIFTPESSIGALNYYNSTGFIINNSIISHNMYGLYTQNSSNFKIINNQVFDQIGYGLDPHSGSKDFLIDSNHLFLNGKQGVICSHQCKNVTISNNIVEYNNEGIGLHWLTNSSTIKNNIIKYNKEYGLFVKTDSSYNLLENNTLIGNGQGIALIENSNNNTVRNNTILFNILTEDSIFTDKNSDSNIISDNKFTKNRENLSIKEQHDLIQLLDNGIHN